MPHQWFNDCEPEVLAACRSALDVAVSMGATLVPITIPELELLRVAHTVTIVSEMHHSMQVSHVRRHPMLKKLCCLGPCTCCTRILFEYDQTLNLSS
jgi:Asp-tRNA(Asn)/Glu-tRNA(Gln) amidotransferase A subunit family amidase